MKKLLTIFSLINSSISFGQYEAGSWSEFFFGRQPSARAEAMGKGYASIDGDLAAIHFNPAGIATINRLELNTSYTPPGYYSTKGYFTFYGLGLKQSKYFQLALSQFHFDFGKTQVLNANKTPFTERNTLTISSEPINNLLVGINVNYFVWQPGIDKTSTTIYFDFGLIKKFNLSHTHIPQSINLGASISNLNYSHVNATFGGITSKYNLPVITRYGANYQLFIGRHFFPDSLHAIRLLLQSEYQMLLNSKYRSAIKIGGELMILEMLSIRAGYYKEKVYNYGFPDYNKSRIEDFTYGFGIQIPLYRFTKIPMNINFDYTSLPQVNYSRTLADPDKYKTYSLRVTIVKKKAKLKP